MNKIHNRTVHSHEENIMHTEQSSEKTRGRRHLRKSDSEMDITVVIDLRGNKEHPKK